MCAIAATPAPAAAAYNCKGDKRLDLAMQFTVELQGSRVHVTSYGGQDKSGWVSPSLWRLYDASGKQLDEFPKTPLVFVSEMMVGQANLEGLLPGLAYGIELVSADFCGNTRAVRTAVSVPTAAPEQNQPHLSVPTTVLTGLQTGQFRKIQFSLMDDTGIASVAVYVNGEAIQSFRYDDGKSFRWWFDDYPDGTISVLEGPNYYIYPPTKYQGQYVLVEVEATDVLGNVSRTSAWLQL